MKTIGLPTIIGLVLSVAIAVVFWLVGEDTAAVLTVGFLGAIISLLLETIARIEKGQRKLYDSIGIDQLFADSASRDLVREIGYSYKTCQRGSIRDTCLERWPLAVLRECRERLSELSMGRISFESEAHAMLQLIELVQNAENDLQCTSCGDQASFWKSRLGRKYLEINKEAIDRGVGIRRIFIVNRKDIQSSTVREIIEENVDIGVETLVTIADEVPVHLHDDFLLQDGELVFRYMTTPGGSTLSARMSVEPECVQRTRTVLDSLLVLADPASSILSLSG